MRDTENVPLAVRPGGIESAALGERGGLFMESGNIVRQKTAGEGGRHHTAATMRAANLRGAVAQLGERLNGIQEVDGSIPFGSTNFPFLVSR